jgi:hypothetical protein
VRPDGVPRGRLDCNCEEAALFVLSNGDLFDDTPNEGAVTPQSSESSISTPNCESTISSVIAEGPGYLARGECARRAGDSELAASSLPLRVPRRQSALGSGQPPGAPTRSWRPARPGRAGGARRCWSAAAQMPGRARTGPGLPRGLCARGRRKASVGRSLTPQGTCALPRPGASPDELAGAAGRVRRSLPGDTRATVSCTAAR